MLVFQRAYTTKNKIRGLEFDLTENVSLTNGAIGITEPQNVSFELRSFAVSFVLTA